MRDIFFSHWAPPLCGREKERSGSGQAHPPNLKVPSYAQRLFPFVFEKDMMLLPECHVRHRMETFLFHAFEPHLHQRKKELLQKRLDGLERSKRRVSVCLGWDAKTLARALYGTCAFPVFIMSLLLSFWPGFPSASPRVSNTSAEALFNVSVYLVTNVRAHQKKTWGVHDWFTDPVWVAD